MYTPTFKYRRGDTVIVDHKPLTIRSRVVLLDGTKLYDLSNGKRVRESDLADTEHVAQADASED
jgi:hypothetical protein